ncbi:MAG: TadE/TadG family type IV pilus assembly protein [Jatrophihabitans sp.]
MTRALPRRVSDGGAAVAEFAMVTVLLVLLFFGVLQVAAYLYVRNVVSASVADAARYVSASGVDPGVAGARVEELISRSLTPGVAHSLRCTGAAVRDQSSGLDEVVVECHGRLRTSFLPIGRFLSIDVTAHVLKEPT